MKLRILSAIFLMLWVLSFASCGPGGEEIKQRFNAYLPDDNVVAVWDGREFYFADHTLKLDNIIENEDLNNGYLFANGKLYFSTSRENGAFDFSFCVYECDYYGNNKKVVFEKSGYKTHPWATAGQNIFYVEHYENNVLDKSSRRIDSYNLINGEYIAVSAGESKTLHNYQKDRTKNYSCAFDNDILEITNKNVEYRIDKEKLLSSDFGEALKDLDYTYYRFQAIEKNGEDQIYLIYRINTNNNLYPFFICRFIPETDKVEFKSLFFATDIETIYMELL